MSPFTHGECGKGHSYLSFVTQPTHPTSKMLEIVRGDKVATSEYIGLTFKSMYILEYVYIKLCSYAFECFCKKKMHWITFKSMLMICTVMDSISAR